jgi:hypothetical protein
MRVVRHRFVTMSPLSRATNVLSFRASGRQARNASRALFVRPDHLQVLGSIARCPSAGICPAQVQKRQTAEVTVVCEIDWTCYSPWIIAHPEITPHDMFQQPDRLSLHQRSHHITQNRPDGIEPLVRLTDIL